MTPDLELPMHDPRRALRVGGLLLLFAAALAVTFGRDRIPQDPVYHRFVDDRPALGLPNAANVLSNVAFAVVGLAGLAGLRRAALNDPRERRPWQVFFAGVTLTSLGSAWYHLAPSNGTLVWDRLPMTLGFMGLLAALVAERVDPRAGGLLLGPLVAVGAGTVAWWWLGERSGAGDLRPYLLVQYFPLVAIPYLLLAFPRPYSGSGAYLVALGLYLGAKWAETLDAPLLTTSGVSGHTLKHLLAAAAVGAVAWMVATRTPLRTTRPAPG